MKRVTGIGGIFYKSRNPDELLAWYAKHLGLTLEPWGGVVFHWNNPENPTGTGTTVWSLFPESSQHFAPSEAPFMINFRVDNLAALLSTLRSEGCQVDDRTEESELGKFGWVMDPEGRRIELWEPPAGM